MLELLRNYYSQSMKSQLPGFQDYSMTDSALAPMGGSSGVSPQLQDLMRRYQPSMQSRSSMPQMPSNLQFPSQTQSNAFFTL